MNTKSQFLIASALTAALTWGSLTKSFAQTSTNDNKATTQITTASYKAPVSTADNFEILPGGSTEAQDRAKKDKVIGISIDYGVKAKYSAEQVAELLGKRLKELGLSSKDVAFYVTKPDGAQASVQIFIPPGAWFQETVIRNGKTLPNTGIFMASEAYRMLELVSEKYKLSKVVAANQTASVSFDHHP